MKVNLKSIDYITSIENGEEWYKVYSGEDITINGGTDELVDTGIMIDMDNIMSYTTYF